MWSITPIVIHRQWVQLHLDLTTILEIKHDACIGPFGPVSICSLIETQVLVLGMKMDADRRKNKILI